VVAQLRSCANVPQSLVGLGLHRFSVRLLPRPRLREVHIDMIEEVWSLLRSLPRAHRGISQEKLPLSFRLFQVVHNKRRRWIALPGTLVAALIA